ncbi:enoyl-CoA hydratase/isomerase family protein [Amycolatopsis keratiniphila]|uniref:Enoyl-CoA hydratase n=1 Tax=Amycolatopsis keratiniphila subsp. keratiniphila TaxID=227715 RepID=A0A1W2LVQ5_9PSEU|nr:enoyl-CoA hydratase/isomerase family protein [Amycolatopsis keratiniphila]OLZ51949.1 enoyl-CoA hydratase [Amycolatopsis keratiniphila subsp. nogabecina]ONF69763.1 enoyl-CoA hydratase [Amycolatopsis keratiniphila subsp. keratiniphila]SDU61812.1 Enoyl-CoA hydratase/carnithine racemase [Amycolatopsis keratiniphila]
MSTVDYALDDGIAVIWLNRPERLNAVVAELVDDLLEALDAAAKSDARAVVLAGRGRAFCAGHDLKEPTPEGDSRPRLDRLQDVTRRLRGLRQPVIAAVHGYAIGAGAEFAMGCDLILAAEDAVFAFPEVSLGLSVTGAASRLLPLLVGPLKAKELLLLGERVSGAEAYELGLVNATAPADDLMDTALAWAARIAAHPAAAATMAKRALDSGIDSSLDAALELEVSHALITEHSAEVAASSEAFRSRA